MDLEFYTCEQLIDELIGRSTFAGIIFQSEKEARGGPIVVHQNWNITYSSEFTNEQVAGIMEDAVGHFHHLAEGEE